MSSASEDGRGGGSYQSSVSRSDPFYLDTVVFKVEDKLYRVPRHGFEGRSGGPFEACATLPTDGNAEGRSDDSPISLLVKKQDFESLLKVIYSPSYPPGPLRTQHRYARNVFGTQPPTSKEEWLGVLHLSTMWCFDDTRQRAISELPGKDFTDLEKAKVGLQFRIPDWVVQGYAGIAINLKLRVNDLDVSQETKQALFTIRDQFFSEELAELSRGTGQGWHSSHPPSSAVLDDQAWKSHICNSPRAQNSLDKIVREVFSDTLATLI